MQAVIITCYKDKKQLFNLINSFSKNVNFYVHIDKKSKEINLEDFADYKNIYVIKKYRIGWGSLNHLLAIIDLLKVAIKNNDNSYYHIISGQDHMIKKPEEFDNFFANNKNIYMTFMSEEEMPEIILKRYRNGCFNSKLPANKSYINYFNKSYGLVFRNRNIGNFKKIYKGLVWCSMPKDVMNYVLTYSDKNPKFLKSLKHCVVPEEIFFQTIIINSKYKDLAIDDDLRFNDWNRVNGSYPAYLDESYYDRINATNDFFIRKIDSTISKKLIDKYPIK